MTEAPELLQRTSDLAQVYSTLENEKVDVLLIDLLFPSMDSTKVIEHIRLAFPDLKIIIMSGTVDWQLTLRAIKAGADSYLTKPIDWDALRTLLGLCTRRVILCSVRASPSHAPKQRPQFAVGEVAILADRNRVVFAPSAFCALGFSCLLRGHE